MFSNEFAEGQIRNINEGFPSDSLAYTDSYDYLSDSDLEDDEPRRPRSNPNPNSGTVAKTPENLRPGSQSATQVENYHVSAPNFVKPSYFFG